VHRGIERNRVLKRSNHVVICKWHIYVSWIVCIFDRRLCVLDTLQDASLRKILGDASIFSSACKLDGKVHVRIFEISHGTRLGLTGLKDGDEKNSRKKNYCAIRPSINDPSTHGVAFRPFSTPMSRRCIRTAANYTRTYTWSMRYNMLNSRHYARDNLGTR